MLSFSCRNNIFFEDGDDVGQNDYMASLANPASANYDPARWNQTMHSASQVQDRINSIESMNHPSSPNQNDYMASLANPSSPNYDPRRWAQIASSGQEVQGKIDSLESMKTQAGQNDYMMRMMDPASANYDPARWNQTMHSASQVQDRINSIESMNHPMNNLPQGASSNSHPLMNAANNMQNSIDRGMNNVGINKLGVRKF